MFLCTHRNTRPFISITACRLDCGSTHSRTPMFSRTVHRNTGKHSRRRTPSAPVLAIRRSYASCSTVARERTPYSTKGACRRLHKRQGRGGRPHNIRRSGAHRMHSSGRQAMLAMLPPFCHTPCRGERIRFFYASIKIVCARIACGECTQH